MTTNTQNAFSALALRSALLESVASLQYTKMTPIQARVIPVLLDNKDVLAQAKTGSGKTAAFALGLLNKLDVETYETQALVLCPTRELSDQVASEVRRLASGLSNTRVLTLCGGNPMQAQLASLKRQAHVVVGTPGRILKHLEKGTLSLGSVQTLVLDEADRMLDMGFHDDIMNILKTVNPARQTLLFSATYPDQIQKISHSIQTNPVDVRIEEQQTADHIHQVFHTVDDSAKTQALLNLLQTHQPDSCLIFCNTKQRCREVADFLHTHGYSVKALHGDLDQYERDETTLQFVNGSLCVLVATDVAARGIDVEALSVVINVDMAHDPETHLHRIGRTGRAGLDGLAISLVSPREQDRIRALEELLNTTFASSALNTANKQHSPPGQPGMSTLKIKAGKKDKLRPGDIVGALTANDLLAKDHIGKISVQSKQSYVAVEREHATAALTTLNNGKIKGRRFKALRIY